MTTISLLTILCQSESLTELETTARELGCVEIRIVYSACHLLLPSGDRGSFRARRNGDGFVWCSSDSAE